MRQLQSVCSYSIISLMSTLLTKDGTFYTEIQKYFASKNGRCKLFV